MGERGGITSTKELSQGIFLHKIVLPGTTEGIDCIYEFKVELQRLNTLEFTADFEGSKNVSLEGSPGLVQTIMIQAFDTAVVARLRMAKQWTLKSKFRFMIRAAQKQIQEEYLKKEIQDINSQVQRVYKLLDSIPINLSSLTEMEQLLQAHNLSFIDPDFPPVDASIFKEINREPFDQLVHWRRPLDFFRIDYAENLREPSIFAGEIEPNDIRQGELGDCWFMSALACLAERPSLVERLFVTKQISPSGIYRVKLCKNGEWITVTVDDYFPCYPMEGPIFSRSHGNELWVLILEKAYAKLHGHYYLLKGGYATEGMIDLTGCPTIGYSFNDTETEKLIDSGEFWLMMKDFDEEQYLMSASTHGEEKWTENYIGSLPGGLIPGHAYTLISCKDVLGNKLVNLRNPWGKLEWTGDWSDKSPMWTSEMKRALKPVFDDEDGNFWMSYEDFILNFTTLNVCRVKNWDEVRIKGKFIRVQDVEETSHEIVVSKWYYTVDLHERTRLYIGVHQEDERIMGVAMRREYLDIGICVLKRLPDGTITIIEHRDPVIARECEMEVLLDPGSYIILPRTSGCLLRRPVDAPRERVRLLTSSGVLSDLAESTVADIFRKFDMLLNRELSYSEFKGFYECINKSITEVEFKQKVLKKYNSTPTGLSLKGFRDFFKDHIKANGEDSVWLWLENLGYDRELYSIRSRCYILTFHSEAEISVVVRDALNTDLDTLTNKLIIERFGEELDNKNGVRCHYYMNHATHCLSYGIYNDEHLAISVTLDCAASENMIFSSKTPSVRKRVEPDEIEFMIHAMAIPAVDEYIRSAKITWQAV